jgi:hypothetical protein
MRDEPKKRSWGWIGWAVLALFVVYPLSVGPSLWMLSHVKDGRLTKSYEIVYAPLELVCASSEELTDVLGWYEGLWLPSAVGRSTGSGATAGREVRFSLEGGGGIATGANGSGVTFDEGKVHVEKSRILVNDKVVATIPDNAELIEIDYSAGQLTIKADGANVHKARFDK